MTNVYIGFASGRNGEITRGARRRFATGLRIHIN